MSTALNLVLSAMVSSYATPEPTVKVATVKASKVQPVKAATPSDNGSKSAVVTPALPKLGTISAAAFLAVVKDYNVSWNWEENPSTHTTPKEGTTREQVEAALAGYVGFDKKRLLFPQVTMAVRQAQQELNPKLRPITAKPNLTVMGLVAGMPDHHGKMVADLKARERCAVAAIIDFGKVTGHASFKKAVEDHCDPEAAPMILAASEAASTETVVLMAQGLVQDEQGRLAQVRKDMARLIGGQ